MEYIELLQPFEGADKSEITAIDLVEPTKKGVDFGKLCASLSGYYQKCQMGAALELQDKISSDGKEEAEEQSLIEKAKSIITLCGFADEEFGSKMIDKFNAIRQQDKAILQINGKPLSDYDYREIGFKDRLLIAVAYTLAFISG